MTAILEGQLASVLPDFLDPRKSAAAIQYVRVPAIESKLFQYRLAWNPRLLRLNPHAIRRRDFLIEALSGQER